MLLQLLGQCSACLAYIHSGAATAGDPVDYSCLLLKRDPVLQIDQCLSQSPVWSEAGTNLQRGEDAPDGFRFSARVPWNFRMGGHGFCAGGRAQIVRTDGHESSMRIRFENGGNQKANFVRNNAKGSRNTPQGSFEISL